MTAEERIEEALTIALQWSQFDGAHHKAWAIDQIVRTLTGCSEVAKQGVDHRGNPYTYPALGDSEEYVEFITKCKAGEDGPETYSWDEGIAP